MKEARYKRVHDSTWMLLRNRQFVEVRIVATSTTGIDLGRHGGNLWGSISLSVWGSISLSVTYFIYWAICLELMCFTIKYIKVLWSTIKYLKVHLKKRIQGYYYLQMNIYLLPYDFSRCSAITCSLRSSLKGQKRERGVRRTHKFRWYYRKLQENSWGSFAI